MRLLNDAERERLGVIAQECGYSHILGAIATELDHSAITADLHNADHPRGDTLTTIATRLYAIAEELVALDKN